MLDYRIAGATGFLRPRQGATIVASIEATVASVAPTASVAVVVVIK